MRAPTFQGGARDRSAPALGQAVIAAGKVARVIMRRQLRRAGHGSRSTSPRVLGFHDRHLPRRLRHGDPGDWTGETISAFGPAGERKLTDATATWCWPPPGVALKWERGTPEPAIFKEAAAAIAREHFEAAGASGRQRPEGLADIDLMGMHGQTVLHERLQEGRRGPARCNSGDARWLADAAGVPVAYDFRTADVAAGGERLGLDLPPRPAPRPRDYPRPWRC